MSPLYSRNTRSQKTLVGRAQWGIHPGYPRKTYTSKYWRDHLYSLATALRDSLEHPVCLLSPCPGT